MAVQSGAFCYADAAAAAASACAAFEPVSQLTGSGSSLTLTYTTCSGIGTSAPNVPNGSLIPMWIWIPFIGIALGIYAVPKSYAVLSNSIHGKGVSTTDKTTSPPFSPPLPTSSTTPLPQPPSGSGAFAPSPPLGAVVVVDEASKISACLASKTKCVCYTHHGVHIQMTDIECRKNAQEVTSKYRLDLPNSYQLPDNYIPKETASSQSAQTAPAVGGI